MKINIAGLMTIIADEESKFSSLGNSLRNHVYNISIQELNGTTNIVEDYKKDFEKEMEAYKKSLKKINKLRAILFEKNNTFKLSDGRTIQEAIIENSNLRKQTGTYEYILTFRDTKRRVTEVNNSYFENKTVNYNVEKIKNELETLKQKIQQTDIEISKLNSIEFDVEI